MLPLRPGQVQRHAHDYKRRGTTTLFAALNVATGEVEGECLPRHCHQEFLRFLRKPNATLPEKKFHLILDNYDTHKHAKVKVWLARQPAFISISPLTGAF